MRCGPNLSKLTACSSGRTPAALRLLLCAAERALGGVDTAMDAEAYHRWYETPRGRWIGQRKASPFCTMQMARG